MSDKVFRALAVSSVAGIMAAGCAANRTETETAEGDRTEDGRQASDTAYYPGTGVGGASDTVFPDTAYYPGMDEEGGSGVGGAPDATPPDPTATDTNGVYGDPNAWPTGPMPGDTGVGGAGSPAPDTVWMDTVSPADTFGIPDEEPGGMPGGGTGPDTW
jgi:hypothetical protein